MKKREIAGFTLIEAMVLVAVLGILAAIGIPNYSRYITRGQLVEAGNALAEYRAAYGTVLQGQQHLRESRRVRSGSARQPG